MTQLTERQQQIRDLYTRGYSIRATARIIGVSPSTIRDHLEAIHRKMAKGASNEQNRH